MLYPLSYEGGVESITPRAFSPSPCWLARSSLQEVTCVSVPHPAVGRRVGRSAGSRMG